MPKSTSHAALAFCLAALVSVTSPAAAKIEVRSDVIIVSQPNYQVRFSPRDGSILQLRAAGQTQSIASSGENGLWHLRFRDGQVLRAADIARETTPGSFSYSVSQQPEVLTLHYKTGKAQLRITATPRANGIELRGTIAPQGGTVLDFALPSRLRFAPASVQRFIAPATGHEAVGFAFKRGFFEPQPVENPVGWKHENGSTGAYQALFGGPLDQRADGDEAIQLRATSTAREWFSPELLARSGSTSAVVNRASTRAQVDIPLLESANGIYFGGSRLGGQGGALWRVGGPVYEAQAPLVAEVISATVQKLASATSPHRRKIALIALKNGPARGGWADIDVSTWREQLRRVPNAEFVEIDSSSALKAALESENYLAILNPYGEWFPVLPGSDQASTVQTVKNFVHGGGHWFESGGYSFFYALRPLRHFVREMPYPAAFADFLHLQSRFGNLSVFGVQPRRHAPWSAARAPRNIFVPATLRYGSDENGGFCERVFGTWVNSAQTWQSPRVQLLLGPTAPQALTAYAQANAFTRRLEDKMSPQLLRRFKNAVLVKYDGPAREKIEHLKYLPVPSVVHFSDYLKGGFDKEYPDHLPPNSYFGTAAELKEFFQRGRQSGHLMVPYTNPTWWSDHPRGPTFQREGEAPLLRRVDGSLAYEKYSAADGWTITMWHPAVRRANQALRQQFTGQYPVDVLFQDQVGARSWQYDLNPASPTPYAYIEGMLSQAQEDSTVRPLSTENGWDQLINIESQFSGLSFGMVPTENEPEWRRLVKEEIPPHLWELFPLTHYLAHDKVAFLHHDLGQFVTNQETLSWTLGLGYGLSYRSNAAGLAKDAPREWLRWLDRLQKSVVSKTIGAPLRNWSHQRGANSSFHDDGVLRATYGSVSVVSNLGPQTRDANGFRLAPYGFRVNAPNLIAAHWQPANVNVATSFVTQSTSTGLASWIYAAGQTTAHIKLPGQAAGTFTVRLAGVAPQKATLQNGVLKVLLPPRGAKRIAPPASQVGKAPRHWLQNKTIGIINLGATVGTPWSSITPAAWKQAFDESSLVREIGFETKYLTTPSEVLEALRGGPQKYFVIINAHTENFPITGPRQWKAMLDAVRGYVENGGQWWETGGYSFYSPAWQQNGEWQSENIGPAGAAYLGMPVGGGEVNELARPLSATPQGQEWLGTELSHKIGTLESAGNRALARGGDDPGHVTLIESAGRDFIGGYRLNGWGYLWRVGGFQPNPQVLLPTVLAVTQYTYRQAPQLTSAGGIKYLWHANISKN
jgi:hypothetical protein